MTQAPPPDVADLVRRLKKMEEELDEGFACSVPLEEKLVGLLREAADALAPQTCCGWTNTDAEDGDVFDTGCGQMFQFNEGGPLENSFTACPYCGRPLRVIVDDPLPAPPSEGR